MSAMMEIAPPAALIVPKVGREQPPTPRPGSRRRHKPASLSHPTEVDSFSVHRRDDSDGYEHNRSLLRRLVNVGNRRDVIYDLNDGFDDVSAAQLRQQQPAATVEKKVHRPQKLPLNDLLRCVSENKPLLEQLPDFVCMRRTLQLIMCTPYEVMCSGKGAKGWRIAARKIAGSWYLCEIWEKQRRSPDTERLMHWAFRFEEYMTTSDDGVATSGCCEGDRCNAPACTLGAQAAAAGSERSAGAVRGGSFYSVLYALLGDHSLLYGGEVDCCRTEDGDPPGVYAEVKTSKMCLSETHANVFARRKFLQWWAQSYLSGVPGIICGFRDDFGFVRQVKEYSTSELPNLAFERGIHWDPAVCFQFLDHVLNHVKNVAYAEGYVHVLEFNPPSREITSKVFPFAESPCEFPPEWFCNIISVD